MGEIHRIFNLKFIVNTREAKNEPPHVHVAKGRSRTNDMKFWLTPKVKIAYIQGDFDVADIAKAKDVVKSLRLQFIKEYEAVHGKAKKRG